MTATNNKETAMETLSEYHITDIRNGSIYGHGTNHCDESGCNGDEMFLGSHRVETVGLSEEDSDTGILVEVGSEGMCVVAWDSGVTTPADLAVLRPVEK